MDNLKKIGLTALGTALVASSSYAAELTATGSAQITFAGEEEQLTGNGWSMDEEVTLAATSDTLDIGDGWVVTASFQLDGGAGQGNSFDNTKIVMDMGDMGTLTFAGHGNSGAVNAIDDMTPNANEEAWALVTDNDGAANGNAGVDNNWTYKSAELMDGLTINATYQPSHQAAQLSGSLEYGLTYTGFEGLTVGFATGDNEAAAAQISSSAFYAKYAVDAFTIGAQMNESDSDTANADEDFTAYSVSYQVNDDFSVSYGLAEVDYENSTKESQESSGVSFSYTSGGMTLSGSHNSTDNVAGTSANDRSGYELNLKFAF